MARSVIRLELQREAFEALHGALERLRATSKTVTVDRDALATLLRDHGTLIAHLKAEG